MTNFHVNCLRQLVILVKGVSLKSTRILWAHKGLYLLSKCKILSLLCLDTLYRSFQNIDAVLKILIIWLLHCAGLFVRYSFYVDQESSLISEVSVQEMKTSVG